MKEELLHYLWKTQQFKQKNLRTVCGKTLHIIHTGIPNRHAGPDFLAGKIMLDQMVVHGPIEVHTQSSLWYEHQHQTAARYNKVILHVVWEDDQPVVNAKGKPIPTLVLRGKVKEDLMARIRMLMEADADIPCDTQFARVSATTRLQALEKSLLQRFHEKYHFVQQLFDEHQQDTETTAYHLLGYNFGFKVNSQPFLQLVQRLSWSLLQKHRPNLLNLEALLLGQAGFLSPPTSPTEDYPVALMDTYATLKRKHKLPPSLPKDVWTFTGLRPANFPTIRIVQFAKLLFLYPDLFPLLVNSTPKMLRSRLALQQSSYWRTHYFLHKKSLGNIGGLGKKSIENIIINSVVPLLVSSGHLKRNDFFIEKGFALLRSLPPEDNALTRQWHKVGFQPKNAFESQAAIQLLKGLCKPKKCLSCDVGSYLVQNPMSQQAR